MSTVSLEDARRNLNELIVRAIHGEFIVIQHNGTRVALRPLTSSGNDPDLAPPGYFAQDYSPEDIAELNHLAAEGPVRIVP